MSDLRTTDASRPRLTVRHLTVRYGAPRRGTEAIADVDLDVAAGEFVVVDWVEGDALYVPPNVWHQHGNSDEHEEAVVLLTTNAPMLLGLGVCTMEPAPTWEEAMKRPPVYTQPVLRTDTVGGQ